MAKIDSRFREDSLGALCQLVHIEPDALRPLLDWINAPPNLQQFRAVIGNLLQLFEFAQSSPLLPELNLDEVRVTEWKTTLQTLHDALPADFPRELRHLNAREDVRPNGLIGSYSEYASLVASDPHYPAEQEVPIRYLHFIALGCAAGYRQQIASGEVKQPTECIYSGMLKIRALEKQNKRPAFPIPDLTAATSLDECQAQFEALANAASDDDSHTWCQMIRGLIRAYREGREGNRGGYRLKVDRVVEPETLSEQDDPDWTAETGDSRPPQKPVTVTTFVSRPDKASSRELTNLGLSPEEWATQTAIAFDEPGAPIHATQNAQLSRLRNRGRLNAIIQSAQTLPDSWGTPTAYEIEQLVRQLSRDLQPALKTVTPADIPALQAILLLRLWTGRALDDLLALRLAPDLESYSARNQQQLTFIEDAAVLALPISSPARQRGINPIDQALLQSPELGGRPASSENSIFVRLPNTATAILKKFFDGWHQTKRRKASSQPFQHRNTNFAEGIKSYLANINDQSATRWTEARLSQIMRQAILQSSGDQVFVYLLTRQEPGHAVVAAHYQCTDVGYLTAVFQRAHKWIMSTVRDGTAPHHPPLEALPHVAGIGSQLAVSDTFVRELSSHLKQAIRSQQRQSPSLTTWVGIHNALVAYITHWLGFCSGYRAVRDPLHDPLELDQQTGLLVISDKDDDSYRHSRVVSLPLSFVDQMNEYVEHLLSLANKLTNKSDLQIHIHQLCQLYRDPDAKRNGISQHIPFLFFLSPQLRVRSISPSTLGEFNPTDLPANIDRHYLRSKLSELGAPPEYIDYYMGHWERGEEPYQKYSMISPLQIGRILQPYLAQINKACGWRVQIGLRGS